MKQSVIDPEFCTVYCCLKQCSQCNNYDGCAAKPNYPVPATYKTALAANWPEAISQAPKLMNMFLWFGGF